MNRIFKRLFCKHLYYPVRQYRNKRYIYFRCCRCGKVVFKERLSYADNITKAGYKR